MSDHLQLALTDLRRTMGKMEIALGLIDEAIVWINAAGEIEWCNGVFDTMMGKSHIEIIGACLIDIMALQELGTGVPQVPHPVLRLLESKELPSAYYQVAADGLPVELIGMPLRFHNHSGGAIVTIRDVSELQEQQQARLQSLALQAAADATVITDASGHIEWVNRAFTTLTGYSPEAVYGRGMKILQSGKTPLDTYSKMWAAITAGEVWKGELINKCFDGRIYNEEQSITPVRDRSGTVTHYIAIKRDITQRKETEREIRKLSSVATRTDNSVIITNPSGEIEWVNAAFTKVTEFKLDEVIGKRPGSFLQGPETDGTIIREMSEKLKSQKGFNVEIINYSKSRRKYWLSIEVRPLYDDDGQLINFLAIENDITERKLSEDKLAAAHQREIDIASRIQRTLLLGRKNERISGVQVAAISVPSQQVDGDFFDCFVLSEDCMDVVIGDVMGKGVPAALLGAATKNAILRSMSSIISGARDNRLPSPREIIMSLHAGLTKELIALDRFVTLFYARIHGKKKTMHFVDCGHTRSIRCGQGDSACQLFSGPNMPLGFMARETYMETEVELKSGDVIVLYSDGITEAANATGEMFGEERLLEVVGKQRHLACKAILDHIHRAVQEFTAQTVFSDDLTCLVIKIDENWKLVPLGTVEFIYDARLELLADLRRDLKTFVLNQYDPGEVAETLDQLLAGVNEAATNIMQHGFLQPEPENAIRMKLAARPRQIEIKLCHNGAAFAGISTILPVPEGHSDSGYGLYIMEQSMDAVHYTRRADGWNEVVMIKDIKTAEELQNET